MELRARLYRADGDDRSAIVSTEPSAGQPDHFLIRVARKGAGNVYGPFPVDVLEARFDEVVKALLDEGFVRSGSVELLERLGHANPAVRGRAAVRLGVRRAKEAVPALLDAATRAKADLPVIVDALGMIGDPAAIPLARSLAEKKNLSRRRSGVEALRNLGDTEGLAISRQSGLERLPAGVTAALASLDESKVRRADVAALMKAIDAEDVRRRGVIADTLYEAGSPLTVAVARRLLNAENLAAPHQWRYAKSLLKRAMLRRDATTFGAMAHAIERAAQHTKGTTATIKSGQDGKPRTLLVFGKKTQRYVQRATWRHLRDLAKWAPDQYTEAAAEVLVHYRASDAGEPKKLHGAWANAFLLQRILRGRSARLTLDWPSLRHRSVSAKAVAAPPEGVREESYPELWDRYPVPFLTLLARARHLDVSDFALAGVRRHPEVLTTAETRAVVALLSAERNEIVELALSELRRRFDPDAPDLRLIAAVLRAGQPASRALVAEWLEVSLDAWITDPARTLRFLRSPDPAMRLTVANLAARGLAGAAPEVRETLATQLLATLEEPTDDPGAHLALVRLARAALLDVLEPRLDTETLLAWIRGGHDAQRQLAGAVLGRRPDALEALGDEGLLALTEADAFAVRAAGHAILEGARSHFSRQPSLLFTIVESDWEDTRRVAATVLASLDLRALGVDALIGLADSTRPDVQALGVSLITRHFETLDPETVLYRLAEHPAQTIRRFALTLVRAHLPAGFVPLAKIEGFCRACLLELRPDRQLKVGLLDFLLERALMDERQAEQVATVLADVVRSHTVFDFQLVSAALARIHLAYPSTESPLRLVEHAS